MRIWLTIISLIFLGSEICEANCPYNRKVAHNIWVKQFYNCEGITNVPTKKRVVALTFDDGPFEPYTSQLLKLLEEEKVPATFFMLGKQVEENPKLVRKVAELGHEIGTHSYAHIKFTRLKPWQIKQEFLNNLEILHKITGKTPSLFRPPYGVCNQAVPVIAKQIPLKIVLWSADARDYEPSLTAEQIVTDVMKTLKPGAIIALHDGGGDRSKTVAAVKILIERLKKRRYRLVTVSELLKLSPLQL